LFIKIEYQRRIKMKIAVSATEKDLDAPIDSRFGRCAYFLIIDTESMQFEAFDNENIALPGGAGIQSAQFLSSKGVDVLITGNIGPNAVRTLAAAGIKMVFGQSGTIKQTILDYKAGRLKATSEPNVPGHTGMGGGIGGGRGMGRGSGMNRGGRRGGIK
jgi:predicted Fe-Mo cluster-binding NifX family protein